LRKVNELALNPGMNVQDGMLTTHSERTYLAPEAELLREFLGAPDEMIDCPTPAQRELFGLKRRRVPEMMDLKNPILLGPVQNQEHHMNGVVARRNNFNEPILKFLEQAYDEFGQLTGRFYSSRNRVQNRRRRYRVRFPGLCCREYRGCVLITCETSAMQSWFHPCQCSSSISGSGNHQCSPRQEECHLLERTDEGMAGDNPLARDIRVALGKALEAHRYGGELPGMTLEETPRLFRGSYGIGSRDFRPEHALGAYEFAIGQTRRKDGASSTDGETYFTLGIDHPYSVISKDTPSLLPDKAIAVRFHSIGGWGMITTGKNLGSIIGDFGSLISEQDPKYDAEGQRWRNSGSWLTPNTARKRKARPQTIILSSLPSPIRVNCELNHVDVVLCCDPKAFTHTQSTGRFEQRRLFGLGIQRNS
jgi:pyruvate-ferredoxin/flavodoxin oxidoreductase